MLREEPGVEIVLGMPPEDFDAKIRRGLVDNRAFGALIAHRAAKITEGERTEVRARMEDAGIPREMTETDDALDGIAAAIYDRLMR